LEGGSTSSRYLLGTNRLAKYWEALQLDGLGSMRQDVNMNNSARFTGSFDYSAFGEKIGGSGGSSSPYGWGAQSGYRQDGGSGQGDCGLVQVGARYYDRDSGRFVTRDTDLDEAPYAYCDGAPINYSDPDGHQKDDKAKKKKPTDPSTDTVPSGTGSTGGGGDTSNSGNPSGMKYFTEPWLRDEMDDEAERAVVKDYRRHVAALMPHFSPDLQTFAASISLHDGLLSRAVADMEQATLRLTLRCGDLQVDYFDLELYYLQVLFTPEAVENLAGLAANPSLEDMHNMHRCSEALYDELDMEGEIFVHRILFLLGREWHELTVRFKQMQLRTTPREFRYDVELWPRPSYDDEE